MQTRLWVLTRLATAFILPGAVDLGANAFGDEPVVIYKGERLRWRNADSVEHDVVADTASLPEFVTTGILAPGGERVFTMNTIGNDEDPLLDSPADGRHARRAGTLT